MRHAVSHAARAAPHLVQPTCLDIVPSRLWQELLLNISSDMVDTIKLFKKIDKDAKAALACVLRPVSLRPYEVLYEAYETGDEM